jgi:hypothetical protein
MKFGQKPCVPGQGEPQAVGFDAVAGCAAGHVAAGEAPGECSLAGLDLLLTPPGSPRVEVSHGFQHSHQPSCFGEKTAVTECSRSARRYFFGALGELIDG